MAENTFWVEMLKFCHTKISSLYDINYLTFTYRYIPYFREYKTIFFFPSPWVATYTIDTTYLSFFSKKKLGKKSCFKAKL